MITPRFLRLLLWTLLAGAVSPAFAQDAAQLRFETKDPQTGLPKGWAAGIGKGTSGIQSAARLRLDSIVKQEGRYSLSMEFKGTEPFVSAVHIINKKPEAGSIKLTGYLKTENVEGWAGLWMRIDGKDQVIQFDNMQSRGVSGTTDWKQYEITLPYDKDEAERINVGALLVGKGKIWVDNFSVTADGKDIKDAAVYAKPLLPADKDTAHFRGSGIRYITLTPELVDRLAKLGAIWGFVKYYHTGVQGGNHNMDAALLRFLPMILAAKDDAQAAEFVERWVDMFGKPSACPTCKNVDEATDVALKPNHGLLFEKGNLPATLAEKLEYLRANRYPGGQKHYYIDMVKGIGNPIFNNEYAYSDQPYPDAGLRLLSLFRYWNMIRYFFPYRQLIGEDWNKVLPEFIPEFCNAADTTAYQLAVLKLIARVHDSHAGLWGGATKLQDAQGKLITPFRAQFVEDKLVVTGYYNDTLNVKAKVVVGDVIDSIDGLAVAELIKQYLPLTPGSNYEAQLRDMTSMRGLLLRSNNKVATIHVSGSGKGYNVDVTRIPANWNMQLQEAARGRYDSAYKLMNGNIAYLFPARFAETTIDTLKKLFQNTRGLVIDLRCYPGTFMPFSYGEWLKPKPTAFARFTYGSTDIPGLFLKTEPITNGKDNSDAYKGKVVIIVNEVTQSQAEYTTMALQTIPGAITIGSTTAGADGNVSEIMLPGGLRTMISGIGVLYPDGTETQRKGVKIDRVIKPTIKGVREGKDELLEAALRIINGK